METEQIYALVNDVYGQMAGSEPITAIDTSTLVSMGDAVLSSTANTEAFMNTLVQRIGKTIISYRKYTNQLSKLVMDDFQFGAIVQKIKVDMPTATADDAYELTDGVSVDQYKVAKPTAKQKLFVTRTPYKFFVTIQDVQLEEAFTSAEAMGSFIQAIYGEVQNKLEVTLEDLGRLAMASYMANAGSSQIVNLVTTYNAATTSTLTAATALFDADFLRYAIATIRNYARRMETMSSLYNKEGEMRHTPQADQIYACLLDFETQLETVVQYAAFNEKFVSKIPTIEVPYWQAAQTPNQINLSVKDGAGTKNVTLNNVVAFLFDREALGTYRKEKRVATSPYNASGLYFNTFWHEKQMWFNDMSENGIIFTLN